MGYVDKRSFDDIINDILLNKKLIDFLMMSITELLDMNILLELLSIVF